ncbi:hypothetical protein [Rhodobacter capsulatus]|uniref:hypothetical protein n=1 Tax=Rhodobacter capsulatus TaxID=1061 RepID=UPI0040284F19
MDRIEITTFAPAEPGAFDAAVAALSPAAALQARACYGEIAAAAGRGLRRVQILAGGRRIGLAQVLGRGGLWLCSRGPVFVPDLPEEIRRRALRALARALPGLLIVTPETPVAGPGLVPLITARHQAIWDLSPEEAALRAGLQGEMAQPSGDGGTRGAAGQGRAHGRLADRRRGAAAPGPRLPRPAARLCRRLGAARPRIGAGAFGGHRRGAASGRGDGAAGGGGGGGELSSGLVGARGPGGGGA